MKVNVVSRMGLLVGGILLVGVLVGCVKPTDGSDDPEPQPEPTLEPIPPGTPTPEPTAGEVSFSIPVPDDTNIIPPSEEIELDSTAILILRDRSESVAEICKDESQIDGNPRFHAASKSVADFLFAVLESDPALKDTETWIGAGIFPEGKNLDEKNLWDYTLREVSSYRGPYPIDALSRADTDNNGINDSWDERTRSIWEADMEEGYAFHEALINATEALRATTAKNLHIIIVGDGMVNYGGFSDWDSILHDNNGLFDLLQGNTSLQILPVHLNYLLVDCLPKENKLLISRGRYVTDNLDRWKEVDGFYTAPIWPVVGSPWPNNTLIKVYGSTEFLLGNRLLTDAEAIQQLLYSIMPDGYIPVRDDELWLKRRALININDATDSIVLPVPGVAQEVVVHMLTPDETLGLSASVSVEDINMVPQTGIRKTFIIKPPENPNDNCEGWWIRLERPPQAPVIVWWEVIPNMVQSINGRVQNVSPNQSGGVIVESSTGLTVDFDEPDINGSMEYVNNCSRVESRWVSANEVDDDDDDFGFDKNDSFPGSLTFAGVSQLAFDPGLVSKSEAGFTLQWQPVLLWKVDVRDQNGEIHREVETIPIEPVAAGAGGGGYDSAIQQPDATIVTFNFRPSLNQESSSWKCPPGEEPVCTIVFNVSFATEDYYPDKNLSKPEYYLLSRNPAESIDDEDCKRKPQLDGQISFIDSNGDKWHYLRLNDEITDWILDGSGIKAEGNEIEIRFRRDRITDCTYEYLVVEWEFPQTMIVYDLEGYDFHSGLMFTH